MLQSYTLPQLVRLELTAFREDWEEAFLYVDYSRDDSISMARSICNLGIIKFLREYQIDLPEMESQFDWAICFLITKLNIK